MLLETGFVCSLVILWTCCQRRPCPGCVCRSLPPDQTLPGQHPHRWHTVEQAGNWRSVWYIRSSLWIFKSSVHISCQSNWPLFGRLTASTRLRQSAPSQWN